MKQRERRAERRRLKAMAWRAKRQHILLQRIGRDARRGRLPVYEMWDSGYCIRLAQCANGTIVVLDIREGFPPFVRASF